MRKISTLIALIFLVGCSQYKDARLLCIGEIESEIAGHKSTEKNQYVILKIKDDSLRISKNNRVFKEWVNVCGKGSNPLVTKDQIYFNVKTCEANADESGLIFEGTYNFASKKLAIKQNEQEGNLSGSFTCQSANLSQIDYKK
jgi:hypothetical protein